MACAVAVAAAQRRDRDALGSRPVSRASVTRSEPHRRHSVPGLQARPGRRHRGCDQTTPLGRRSVFGVTMSNRITVVEINYEDDVVTARQRARQVSRLLTFEEQDQTRISTAVSEIARLFVHSKRPALIEFLIEGTTVPQLLLMDIGWPRGGSAKAGSTIPSNGRNLDSEWESAVTSARR